MPLLPGKRNIGRNISEMEDAGHPRDQAIAAALNTARETSKTARALGGDANALLDRQDELYKSHQEASKRLKELSGGGPMGITPDHIKASPEWKAAKAAHDRSFASLTIFNATNKSALSKIGLEERMARKRRAEGGGVHRYFVGPIHAGVSGRTDHLPMTVESGSYVLPADIVSAGGEGNTLAGFRVLHRTFGGEPYGQSGAPYGQRGGVYGLPVTYAKGGSVRAAGVLFRDPGGKVLLMHRTDGEGWAFPGGGIEKGETPEMAARREVREETGHEHDGGLSPFMHSDTNHVDFTTYLAHAPEEFKPRLNHEHDESRWVGLDEAERMPLHPGVRRAIEKLRARKANGGTASGVPIVAAGGEWVISPEQVKRVGNGDLDVGHRVLDAFVKRVRKELIGTLRKLPGPKRD